jgi:hypothetical protein
MEIPGDVTRRILLRDMALGRSRLQPALRISSGRACRELRTSSWR